MNSSKTSMKRRDFPAKSIQMIMILLDQQQVHVGGRKGGQS